MTDSMIMRVARAILESDHGAGSWDESGMPEWAKEDAICHARAAIKAMREPPDAVLGIHPLMDSEKAAEIRASWAWSIDAALAQPPKPR